MENDQRKSTYINQIEEITKHEFTTAIWVLSLNDPMLHGRPSNGTKVTYRKLIHLIGSKEGYKVM